MFPKNKIKQQQQEQQQKINNYYLRTFIVSITQVS